ncbi:MAG: protease modulator HflK [Acidobacteriota bacterium]
MAPDSPMPPPSVRWIRGAVEYTRRRRRAVFGALAAVILLLWLAAGIYSVGNGESAALLRFGRYTGQPVASGLRFRLPGVERVEKVATGEVFRLEIFGEKVPDLVLITGDENLIETTLVVQYQVAETGRFLFGSEDPELLVAQVVRAALVETVASLPVDTVLTSGKAAIQNRVRTEAQRLLEGYGAGVVLTAVNLQAVDPPREAAAAFRDVSDAKAQAAGQISDAESARERELSLARGGAEQLLSRAGADADRRRQQARGAAERFRQVLAQKRRTPGQTETDLWLETVQSTLPQARVIVLAPGQRPVIDVQMVEEGAATPVPRR